MAKVELLPFEISFLSPYAEGIFCKHLKKEPERLSMSINIFTEHCRIQEVLTEHHLGFSVRLCLHSLLRTLLISEGVTLLETNKQVCS